jgi:hypothetical protein
VVLKLRNFFFVIFIYNFTGFEIINSSFSSVWLAIEDFDTHVKVAAWFVLKKKPVFLLPPNALYPDHKNDFALVQFLPFV